MLANEKTALTMIVITIVIIVVVVADVVIVVAVVSMQPVYLCRRTPVMISSLHLTKLMY